MLICERKHQSCVGELQSSKQFWVIKPFLFLNSKYYDLEGCVNDAILNGENNNATDVKTRHATLKYVESMMKDFYDDVLYRICHQANAELMSQKCQNMIMVSTCNNFESINRQFIFDIIKQVFKDSKKQTKSRKMRRGL